MDTDAYLYESSISRQATRESISKTSSGENTPAPVSSRSLLLDLNTSIVKAHDYLLARRSEIYAASKTPSHRTLFLESSRLVKKHPRFSNPFGRSRCRTLPLADVSRELPSYVNRTIVTCSPQLGGLAHIQTIRSVLAEASISQCSSTLMEHCFQGFN